LFQANNNNAEVYKISVSNQQLHLEQVRGVAIILSKTFALPKTMHKGLKPLHKASKSPNLRERNNNNNNRAVGVLGRDIIVRKIFSLQEFLL
jgi:hypothetical protein